MPRSRVHVELNKGEACNARLAKVVFSSRLCAVRYGLRGAVKQKVHLSPKPRSCP